MRFNKAKSGSSAWVTTSPAVLQAGGRVAEKLPSGKGRECWLTAAEHEPECAQVAKKVNGILACMRNHGQKDQQIISLNLALVRPHLKSCIHFLGLSLQDNIQVLEHVQRRATKQVKGLKHKSCENQLRELGVFSLQKRRLSGEIATLYNHLRLCSWVGVGLFNQVTSNRMRGNGFMSWEF
ncbi:hypothetical protein WISP_102046 [Willisornis vidua]|uniref:Uncharacterized protein n=1 Tax=Willisornis vidua TaxID=1566151 RepID=A0ABQ9D452_9PASS|nr:hypothetical protein WISP_102046 [Willisornis vidua]